MMFFIMMIIMVRTVFTSFTARVTVTGIIAVVISLAGVGACALAGFEMGFYFEHGFSVR